MIDKMIKYNQMTLTDLILEDKKPRYDAETKTWYHPDKCICKICKK